ncbi:sensor histidine kinase [Desertibacillus haloalkaliphilus]|uniref:sensor histidine kinase n=1 Tax=Desertibacillus haloalkaliphilus TaxID=1328930 RepID=UPI001C254103|nr:ATP-binding protein [Desertibacillus haloalkaliphilus]MBU8908714.1 HAMP domain-containing protein [Desertibacillus haloalkaliphilus]
MWRITIVNSLVIGVVIWIVGISVKDYACYLIEQENTLTAAQRAAFINQMDSYLVFAVILAVIVAAIVHFYFIHSLLDPLRTLTEATKEMTNGHEPKPIPIANDDEIGKLTEHFNHMVQQIKRNEDAREKLTRNVAHELRTPLTNINGYLEALRSGVIQGDRKLYDSLYEESSRLTELVEQLQQINIWHAGTQTSQDEYERLSMKDLIEQQIEHFQLQLQKQAIEVRTSIENKEVTASEGGLKQVLNNLFENVLRYDRGGWMEVQGMMTEKGYKVQVRNEGVPIPVTSPDQPFERFYRADGSRNRKLGGSGLGLAIVKEIIESHDGEVGFQTNENIHTFSFTLPVK